MAAQIIPLTKRSLQINGKVSLKSLARLIELSKMPRAQVLSIDFSGSADVAQKDHLTFDHFSKAWVTIEVQISSEGPIKWQQQKGAITFETVTFA